MVQRWALYDSLLGETYTFPLNPNAMISPFGNRSLTVLATAPTIGQPRSQGRVIEGNPDPYEWSFSGKIKTQDHHDELLRWSRKVNRLTLTDHLVRTFSIRMLQFIPTELRPTANISWRFTYEVKVLNYGVVA